MLLSSYPNSLDCWLCNFQTPRKNRVRVGGELNQCPHDKNEDAESDFICFHVSPFSVVLAEESEKFHKSPCITLFPMERPANN